MAAMTRLAAVAALKDIDWNLVSSYAGLLLLAVFCVWTGAFGSLPKRKGDRAQTDSTTTKEEINDDEEDFFERMSSSDAWLFPIIGSLVLGGLYLIVVYLGDYWLNAVLRVYFSVAGICSVWKSSMVISRYLVGEARWKNLEQVKVTVRKGSHEVAVLSSRTLCVALLPLALVPSGLYLFWSGSIFLGNILAMSFAHNALSMIKLDSFRTGTILLTGLFVYDVWWVFGTEVMVKVATTVDGPIKLLWPKCVLFCSQRGYTMLGLGDVVIPGMFVGLGLRYDESRKAGRRRYFYATLTGYIVGLMCTMMVMHVVGRAQPALLYVSPACLVSFVVTGLIDGELVQGWQCIKILKK